MGNCASCVSIHYSFSTPASEQKAINRNERQYVAWRGGYVNQEVFDHYETAYHDDAKIKTVEYRINLFGKANGKEQEITSGLVEEMKSKMGGTSDKISEGYYRVVGTNYLATVSLTGSSS